MSRSEMRVEDKVRSTVSEISEVNDDESFLRETEKHEFYGVELELQIKRVVV